MSRDTPGTGSPLAEGKLWGQAQAPSVYNFSHISLWLLTREATNPLIESLHLIEH